MGVDGISGGSPPSPDVPAAKEASPREAFSVEAAAPALNPATDLDRVQSGELSVAEYLEARVNEATRHLEGAMGPEQLSMIREQLQEQLSTDPVLVRLVQRSVGSSDIGSSA
jgi:hypothetical protein